jgi:peptidoglycan/LPS O-acetylase OafA/YrhL
MRLKSFDCARGLASLIVLFYHIPSVNGLSQELGRIHAILTYPFRFGEQSVYFFMGLSGYILTFAFGKYAHRINFLTWASWRSIRLIPMYYFSLSLSYILIPNSSFNLSYLNHSYLFSNNSIYSGANPPLWSLSIEIFLSIALFPVLYFKLILNRKWLIIIAGVFFLLSYVTDIWGVKATFRSIALFVAGVLVARSNISLTKIQKMLSLLLVIAWSTFEIYNVKILNALLLPIVSIILLSLIDTRNRILVNRINLFLGKYSFSLYATHWLSLNLIKGFVQDLHWVILYFISALVSILLSMLAYRIIENPSRKLSSWFIRKGIFL